MTMPFIQLSLYVMIFAASLFNHEHSSKGTLIRLSVQTSLHANVTTGSLLILGD